MPEGVQIDVSIGRRDLPKGYCARPIQYGGRFAVFGEIGAGVRVGKTAEKPKKRTNIKARWRLAPRGRPLKIWAEIQSGDVVPMAWHETLVFCALQ